MSTDDRALADRVDAEIARITGYHPAKELLIEIRPLLDRLEAFHAKPVVGERKKIALALVNEARRFSGFAPYDSLEGLEPHKYRDQLRYADAVLAALQSPPPVVSDLSPPTQRMEKILDAPFVRRSPPVVSGEVYEASVKGRQDFRRAEGWREALEKISTLTVVPISEDHAAANNGKELIRAKAIARQALGLAAMLDAAPIPGEE